MMNFIYLVMGSYVDDGDLYNQEWAVRAMQDRTAATTMANSLQRIVLEGKRPEADPGCSCVRHGELKSVRYFIEAVPFNEASRGLLPRPFTAQEFHTARQSIFPRRKAIGWPEYDRWLAIANWKEFGLGGAIYTVQASDIDLDMAERFRALMAQNRKADAILEKVVSEEKSR